MTKLTNSVLDTLSLRHGDSQTELWRRGSGRRGSGSQGRVLGPERVVGAHQLCIRAGVSVLGERGVLASIPFWKPAGEMQTLRVNLEPRLPFNGFHMTGFSKDVGKCIVWNWKARAGKPHSHLISPTCI